MQREPDIQAFFHEPTNTVSYLVCDPVTAQAALIDPVLDYDHRSGRAGVQAALAMLAAAAQRGVRIQWILETHAHADHLTAAHFLQQHSGASIGIGEHIRQVQAIFGPLFAVEVSGEGREFDRLFKDGEQFGIGELQVEVLHTPGHTPACISYRIGAHVFVGDTLFMPDYGTARADFPGGDARTLYRSIQRLLSLPGHTRLYMCHDYKAPGRDHYAWQTTVQEEREHNVHIRCGVDEAAFVEMRTRRDALLGAPSLLLPSIQVNIRAGRLPEPQANGIRYLRVPLTLEDELAQVR